MNSTDPFFLWFDLQNKVHSKPHLPTPPHRFCDARANFPTFTWKGSRLSWPLAKIFLPLFCAGPRHEAFFNCTRQVLQLKSDSHPQLGPPPLPLETRPWCRLTRPLGPALCGYHAPAGAAALHPPEGVTVVVDGGDAAADVDGEEQSAQQRHRLDLRRDRCAH